MRTVLLDIFGNLSLILLYCVSIIVSVARGISVSFKQLRTGKEIRFRFWLSEDKADTASRSRSQPKMEDNLFTSPNVWKVPLAAMRRSRKVLIGGRNKRC